MLAGATGAMGCETALATGKGFNQDQIVKLKDACGVSSARQISSIWSVINTTKGTSFNTCCTYIAKAIDTSCCPAIQSRGPVAQLHSVARGILILACRLLMAGEAKFCQEYKEAVADTKHTCSLEYLLKGNCGKMV
jgi:hypothetical protein